MENEQKDWAKAENTEVEAAKDAYAEATQAQKLREVLTSYAQGAVKYGNVDRDWINDWLMRLGADPVTGYAEYRINTPITGLYGKTISASTRGEALEKFKKHMACVQNAGKIDPNYSGRVYAVEFDGEPTFFSGPQDPPTGKVDKEIGVDGLKAGIREMLMRGVTEQGWGHKWALDASDAMGLEPMPALVHRTVSVPVSGTAEVTVPVFEGDGPVDVQAAATAAVARMQLVSVKPDEVGAVMSARDGSMGLTLVDEDES